jgi:hypothetical protein
MFQRYVLPPSSPPWLWRQHVPLKRRSTIILHGSTSQKTNLNFILSAMRTWNLTERKLFAFSFCSTCFQQFLKHDIHVRLLRLFKVSKCNFSMFTILYNFKLLLLCYHPWFLLNHLNCNWRLLLGVITALYLNSYFQQYSHDGCTQFRHGSNITFIHCRII